MKLDPRTREKYLCRCRADDVLEPAPASGRRFRRAAVIPACAEEITLPAALAALAANPPELLADTLVVAVINHDPECAPEKQAENRRTLAALRAGGWSPRPPHFAWIDAASPGRENRREGGVGEARKRGMDAALAWLDWDADPLIFCPDADTLVEPAYLAAGLATLAAVPDAAAAVYPFVHQPGDNPAEEAAIRRYEAYLDDYVAGLARAGSPYAYQAMGSAMVCRASAYVAVGGMKARNAGEDFYFLQALRKYGPVLAVTGSTVHPAARPSDRVPFGTGPKIRALVAGEPLPFYAPAGFDRLGEILALATAADWNGLVALPELFAANLPPESLAFLAEYDFTAAWRKIVANTPPRPERLRQAFHIWFDAFRTLKFLHFLAAADPERYGRRPLESV